MKRVSVALHIVLLTVLFTACSAPDLPEYGPYHPPAYAPISPIPDQTIYSNGTTGPLPFSILDTWLRTGNSNLSASSSDTDLVDSSGILFGGPRYARTITVTPKLGRTGTSKITLTASSGRISGSVSFRVTVSLRAENRRYPVILTPLSASRLRELQAEFDSLNTTHIRANLDQYGLLSSYGLVLGARSALTDTGLTDTGLIVSKAREAFVRFSKFTNVTDTSQLSSPSVTRFSIPGQETWRVGFDYQHYDGIEVENTECVASIYNGAWAIAGHHFRDIFVPVRDTISRTRAAQSLTGYTYPYECWGPDTLIIWPEMVLREEIRRVVFPLEVNNTIELRVAWEIPIGSPPNGTSWYFYVDILTGELLHIEQMFIC